MSLPATPTRILLGGCGGSGDILIQVVAQLKNSKRYRYEKISNMED
jgi:hypothetical protein